MGCYLAVMILFFRKTTINITIE